MHDLGLRGMRRGPRNVRTTGSGLHRGPATGLGERGLLRRSDHDPRSDLNQTVGEG